MSRSKAAVPPAIVPSTCKYDCQCLERITGKGEFSHYVNEAYSLLKHHKMGIKAMALRIARSIPGEVSGEELKKLFGGEETPSP